MNNSKPLITPAGDLTASAESAHPTGIKPPSATPLATDKVAMPDTAATADSTSATDKIWFYEIGGQRIGPVTRADMLGLIKSGTLSHGSAVWKKGYPDWLKLENTEWRSQLDDLAPPPLTGQHVNNSVVWVLAFAPVLGFFIEYFVAGAISGSVEGADYAVDSSKYWYLSIILNLALSYWDEKRLEKAGINTERFSGWVWLVPVYLYQRAQALNQNLAYFVVWLVCFALILFG